MDIERKIVSKATLLDLIERSSAYLKNLKSLPGQDSNAVCEAAKRLHQSASEIIQLANEAGVVNEDLFIDSGGWIGPKVSITIVDESFLTQRKKIFRNLTGSRISVGPDMSIPRIGIAPDRFVFVESTEKDMPGITDFKTHFKNAVGHVANNARRILKSERWPAIEKALVEGRPYGWFYDKNPWRVAKLGLDA